MLISDVFAQQCKDIAKQLILLTPERKNNKKKYFCIG